MIRVEIASFDSVAGWLLMVSNSGAYTGARVSAETAEELFRNPNDWFIAAAFPPPVEAREVDGDSIQSSPSREKVTRACIRAARSLLAECFLGSSAERGDLDERTPVTTLEAKAGE